MCLAFLVRVSLAQSVERWVNALWFNQCRRVWVRASRSSLITFLRLAFFVFVFLFLRKSQIFFYIFFLFYFTRTMKINTGHRQWVQTEKLFRLTTMDDNNTLTVFTGYYTRSLFPLPAFLNGVAGIHPVLISLNEIMTPVLEFFLAYIERDSLCYNIFVSSQ